MNFLVLCLVALITWLSPRRAALVRDPACRWMDRVQRLAVKREGSSSWWLGLGIAAPLFVLLVLLWLVDGIAHGLFTLLLHVLVLMVCVSRSDPLGAMTSSIERAWQRGDPQAAALIAERDWSIRADNEEHLGQAVRASVALEALRGYFVPAFWYLLLGPVAALGYRLTWLTAARSGPAGKVAGEARQALEWVPLRLLGVSLALVGRLAQTMKVLRRDITDWDTPNSQLLSRLVEAALGAPASSEPRLRHTRRLLLHCLLLWAVIIAFLSLVG